MVSVLHCGRGGDFLPSSPTNCCCARGLACLGGWMAQSSFLSREARAGNGTRLPVGSPDWVLAFPLGHLTPRLLWQHILAWGQEAQPPICWISFSFPICKMELVRGPTADEPAGAQHRAPSPLYFLCPVFPTQAAPVLFLGTFLLSASPEPGSGGGRGVWAEPQGLQLLLSAF